MRDLLELDDAARAAGVSLVVGAAVSPGLSGLFARHLAAASMSVCDELHVTVHGTAGPACAREHHRSLRGWAIGWHDGRWIERPAGSGRELCWFPEPVGARDSYRAEMPDPWLLHRSFPVVARISARRVGDAARPGHGAAADAQPAAPRGRCRRAAASRRAARDERGRARDAGDRHGRAHRHRGVGRGRRVRRPARRCRPPRRASSRRATPTCRPTALLAAVARGGVRLQAFTGIPHTG